MAKPRVLLIGTSSTDMFGQGGGTTGVWFEEFAAPFYIFTDAGCQVTMCSTRGGEIPLDQGSRSEDMMTEYTRKFEKDEKAMASLKASTKLADVDLDDYDIAFLAGGHGTYADFTEATVTALVEKFLNTDRVVAAVCHGPNCFNGAKKENGEPLVEGRKITCFSDLEEDNIGLTNKVPYLLQSKMQDLGATVTVAAGWTSHVVTDGKLVTGQNPQSSKACAEAALAAAS